MERPQQTITIRDFTGLVSNRGPLVGKPGDARVLKNLRCRTPGVLEVRGGLRPVKFEA